MSKPTVFQIVKSILAAFLGVQSKQNRIQDFTDGSPSRYIFAGIALTILFIFIIVGVVNLVI